MKILILVLPRPKAQEHQTEHKEVAHHTDGIHPLFECLLNHWTPKTRSLLLSNDPLTKVERCMQTNWHRQPPRRNRCDAKQESPGRYTQKRSRPAKTSKPVLQY